jgi:hypothetical protein
MATSLGPGPSPGVGKNRSVLKAPVRREAYLQGLFTSLIDKAY